MKARTEHIAVTKTARLLLSGEPRLATDVWIVCHGYGQLATRFVRGFDSIARPERLIVAPEALHRYYLDQPPVPARDRRVGASWMTREERDADIADNVAYLDRVAEYVRSLITQPFRLRALGFSQGAATAFRWAALGRTHLDELILWAGQPVTDVDLAQAAARLARTRVRVVHGARDPMVPTSGAVQESLERAGIACETLAFDGGHELESAILLKIAADI